MARWCSDLSRLDATPDDIHLLVKSGREQEAVSIAVDAKELSESVGLILGILEAQVEMSGDSVNKRLLDRASMDIEKIKNPWEQCEFVVRLALIHARLGREDAVRLGFQKLEKLKGGTAGQEKIRGEYLFWLVRDLCKAGQIELAEQAVSLVPSDAAFWNGPHGFGWIIESLAANRQIDRAFSIFEQNSSFFESTNVDKFNYSVLAIRLLEGARTAGTDALFAAASRLDPELIDPRLRLDVAHTVSSSVELLARFLEPAFREVGELAEKLSESKFTSGEEIAVAKSLCYYACRLNHPTAKFLLELGNEVAASRFSGNDFHHDAEHALALDFSSRVEESKVLLVSLVNRTCNDRNLRSCSSQITRLIELVKRRPAFTNLNALDLLESLNEAETATKFAAAFLSEESDFAKRSSVVSHVAELLPKITDLDLLRSYGRHLKHRGESEHCQLVMGRIVEIQQTRAASTESIKEMIRSTAWKGIALIDPNEALQEILDSSYVETELCSLINFLVQRPRNEDHDYALRAAVRHLAEFENSRVIWLNWTESLPVLLDAGLEDEVVKLSRIVIADGGPRFQLGLIVGLCRAEKIDLLEAILEEAEVEFHVYYLILVARSLTQDGTKQQIDQLATHLFEKDSPKNLLHLGLALMDLQREEAAAFLNRSVEVARKIPDDDMFYGGMRNGELRDIVKQLSQKGRLDTAELALRSMKKTPLEDTFHGDWNRAFTALAVAHCRADDLEGADELIAGLSKHDFENRNSLSAVAAAKVETLLERNQLDEASKVYQEIPNAKAQRVASSSIGRFYALAGKYKQAIFQIEGGDLYRRVKRLMTTIFELQKSGVSFELEEFRKLTGDLEGMLPD